MLLSIIMVLSFGVVSAEMGNMTKNMVMPMDMKMPMMSMNMTKNMTMPMNEPKSMTNGSMNMIMLQNVSFNIILIQNLTEITNTMISMSPTNATKNINNALNASKPSARTKSI